MSDLSLFVALEALPALTLAELEARIAKRVCAEVVVEGGHPLMQMVGDGAWMPALPHAITVRGHRLQLFGFEQPFAAMEPELCGQLLQLSHLSAAKKERLAAAPAHLWLQHESGPEDALERLRFLYVAASVFPGICGAFFPPAMLALPAELLAAVGASSKELAQSLPPLCFTGLVKLFRPQGGTWYVSRGHDLFGIPDLAWLGASRTDTRQALELLHGVFEYARLSGNSLRAGDTAEWGARRLRFRAPYEYAEQLAGAGETLVVEEA